MLSFSEFDELLLYDLKGLAENFSYADFDDLTGGLARRETSLELSVSQTEVGFDISGVDGILSSSKLEESTFAQVSTVAYSTLERTGVLVEQKRVSSIDSFNLLETVEQPLSSLFQASQASQNTARMAAPEGFDIEVRFIDNSLTSSQRAIFTQAANRWEEIIVGDIPDVFVSGIGQVDDLVIEASAPFIDGNGGTLGQAAPTRFRRRSSLPALGFMEFDSADVASLEARGQLDEVILHEMGHVLGIGTIWRRLGLLRNEFGSNPRYVGRGAVREYNRIFGNNANSIPVENRGGPGTRGSHWRESVFDNELMTGFLNFGQANPISRMTVASLDDLGYDVNLNAADPYRRPSPRAAIAAGLTSADTTSSLV